MADIILGLDPGSRRAGYGLIRAAGESLEHIEHGVIRMDERLSLAERLQILSVELEKIFDRHVINAAVVEKIFLGKNADSAFKLGHARGVCLLGAARHGVRVHEYAARFVKKAVTGDGGAEKEQVLRVVAALLRISPQSLAFDASDALSLAIAHAQVCDVEKRTRRAREQEGIA